MTQFLSETRERFLVAIAEQLAADRIVEVHFFKPIKQGGIESGVAVVALTKDLSEPTRPSDDATPSPPQSAPRHTVYTAHYRHTLKGVERGKWQVTVVDEADAPLLTVETVVKGVQRRAGDVDDPERMEGDAVRDALAAIAARSSP